MKKVLIIEDDPFIMDIVAHKFSTNGWEVIAVTSGEKGLEELQDFSPNLILLDIMLPGIDGYGVLEKLKRDEHLKQIPVLVLSNNGTDEEKKKSVALGAADHLVKADVIMDAVVVKANNIIATDDSG